MLCPRLAPLIAVTLCATPAVAEPIWDQSPHWVCTLERHLRVEPRGEVVDMDPEGRSYQIDFAAGTITSAFTDNPGRITLRSYFPSEFGNHNVLVADWGSGDYPFVILEEGTGFWEISGSGAGDPDGEAWIAMYQCFARG